MVTAIFSRHWNPDFWCMKTKRRAICEEAVSDSFPEALSAKEIKVSISLSKFPGCRSAYIRRMNDLLQYKTPQLEKWGEFYTPMEELLRTLGVDETLDLARRDGEEFIEVYFRIEDCALLQEKLLNLAKLGKAAKVLSEIFIEEGIEDYEVLMGEHSLLRGLVEKEVKEFEKAQINHPEIKHSFVQPSEDALKAEKKEILDWMLKSQHPAEIKVWNDWAENHSRIWNEKSKRIEEINKALGL